MKRLLILILLLILIIRPASAVPTNGAALNRPYLQTALDGNLKAITNAGRIESSNFSGFIGTLSNGPLGVIWFPQMQYASISNGARIESTNFNGIVGNFTNGVSYNPTNVNPVMTNGVNYGQAFHSPGSGNASEQIGNNATATGSGSLAFGQDAAATANGASAIGNSTTAMKPNTTAIGYGALAAGTNAQAFGYSANAGHDNSTAIGKSATTTTTNQIRIGTAAEYVSIPGNVRIEGAISNAIFAGTNYFPAGSSIAFQKYPLTTLANGANSTVPIGTNVFVELSGNTAAVSLHGLWAGVNRDGDLRFIVYRQSWPFTIANDSGTEPFSTNRIRIATGGDRVFSGPVAMTFIYSGSEGRWLLVGSEGLETLAANITGNAGTATLATNALAVVSGLNTTNVPTRGLVDTATIGPDLTVEWYYTSWYSMPYGFTTNVVTSSYYTNVGYYVSNMCREFKTNGMYAAGWKNFCFDDFWMQTPDGSGHLKPNTALFNTGKLPLALPNLIALAQSQGFKIHAYTAVTTNACGPDSSPINVVYTHVQDMMALGFDGAKFDNCDAIGTGPNSTYYANYFRIVNQAINDYYAAVGKTNGICRPFKIIVTGSSASGWPNAVQTDFSFGVNQWQFQPTIVVSNIINVNAWGSAGMTNGAALLRDALGFRPFFRPGRVPYHGFGVYGNTPICEWTNMIAISVLGCQPVEAGLGSRDGSWDSVDTWSSFYYPTYGKYMTNAEVWAMHSDPLVIPASCTLSNGLFEVYNRPLYNGDSCIGIVNSATTNRTVTLNWYNLGLKPGRGYLMRDPWAGREIGTFCNSYTWTQPASSTSLLRFYESARDGARIIYPTKSYEITGTGFSALSYGTALSPWTEVQGFAQTAANNTAEFAIPVPTWATKVEMVIGYYSAYAGTVNWTNHPYYRWKSTTGTVSVDSAFDPVAYPEIPVSCTNGLITQYTNVLVFPFTNSTKYISFQMKASTNASARYIVGAPEFRFY